MGGLPSHARLHGGRLARYRHHVRISRLHVSLRRSDMNEFQTRRKELQALCDQINGVRLEYVKLIGLLNESTAALVQCADIFLPECDPDDRPTVRKLGYTTKDPSPVDVADFTKPSTRKCSLCNETGHNAKTCTKGRKPAAKPLKRGQEHVNA